MRSRRLRLALLASTALGFAASPALGAAEIGVAAAVNPMAHGFPPAREMRVLQIGSDMAANEKVVTGPRGQAQLLFLDGSALTVGPNSDLVLDSFVYDPETKSGTLALAATKGVFRLVGGQLSKRSPVTIKTPTATVGVRGGIALLQIGDNGLNATFLFGDEMTVTSGGQTQRATRPGFSIQAPAGGPPNPPAPADGGQLEQTLGQFESGSGGDGGIPNPPTDDDVAQTQIAAGNSIEGLAPAAGGPPAAPPPTIPEGAQDEATDASQDEASADSSPDDEDDDAGAGGDDGGQAGPPNQGGGDSVTPPPAGINIAGLSGRFKNGDGGQGTNDGVPGQDIQFAGAAVASGVFTGGGFTLPVEDGEFAVPLTELAPFGGVEYAGTGWLSPNRDFLIYELEDPIDFQRALGFAGIPTPAAAFPSSGFTAYQFRPDFVLDSDAPFIRTGGTGNGSATPAKGYIDWGTGRFLLGKVIIEGQGASQRTAASVLVGQTGGLGDPGTADVNGRFRGSSRVAAQSAPYISHNGYGEGFALQRGGDGAGFFGASGPDYFVLGNGAGTATETGPNGSQTYSPNIVAQKTTATQGARTTATLNGFVGGLAQRVGPDPFVFSIGNFNTETFTAGDPADFALHLDAPSGTLSGALEVNDDSGYGIAVGFGGSDVGESAFFDDDTFAATENGLPVTVGFDQSSDYTFFLTTADAIEAVGGLPPGVALCECQYLRWGVLGLDVGNSGDPTDRVQIQLAGWVAGNVLSMAQLPVTGVAYYAGHVFGNVYDGTNFYSAFGSLQVTFNFASPTAGAVNVSFDGVDYAANVSSIAANGVYTGSGSGAGGRFFDYKAAFFAGGAGPLPAETGGNFRISSDNGYKASGIMAGAQVPPP